MYTPFAFSTTRNFNLKTIKKMETTTNTNNNTQLTDIAQWVTKHFKEEPTDQAKHFNVHCYTQQQREEAMETLTKRGFLCALTHSGNNLSVIS
jgi:4-hydroxy-3-methylbut-2-enyl diphosphate reductase IspH